MSNRLNINLQTEADSLLHPAKRPELDRKSYKSPHKKIISYKTEMRKPDSRQIYNPDSINESVEEIAAGNDNFEPSSKFTPKGEQKMQPVQMPFQQHNSNRGQNKPLVPPTQTNKQDNRNQLDQFEQEMGYGRKDIENYNVSYLSKAPEYDKDQISTGQPIMNSYKSQRNLKKAPFRKSPSDEYRMIKKKIEKEMRSPAQQLFTSQKKVGKDIKKSVRRNSKLSPNTSVRQLRSNSPNFKFVQSTSKENPMDLYRKRKVEEHKRHRKMSSEYMNSSADRESQKTKEFSNEKIKTNIPRPSVSSSKFNFKSQAKQGLISLTAKKENETENSLRKLNEKARYRSPKIKGLTSGRKVPYEEALGYSSLNQSRSHAYLSPNNVPNRMNHHNRFKSRKGSDKLGHSPNTSTVFDRLYKEKDANRIKQEVIREEFEIQKKSAEKIRARQSISHSKSKSKSKSRKASKSPEDFYRKQMQMKIESERKLIMMMYEKAKNYESETKAKSKHSSKSRKASDVSGFDKSKLDVHDRLFNDVKERSRKQMGLDSDPGNRHYESLGNLSLSSLCKGEPRKRGEIPKHATSESLYVPHINSKSKQLAATKRTKSNSINTILYKDAEARREKLKTERKRSRSKEKEQIAKAKKGTLQTSKKMLIKKYLIEFDEIAQKLGVGEEPESPIHYTQFIMLMQQLCFVNEETEPEIEKLKMIWGIVQDQETNADSGHYCRKHSLKVICAAICGFNSKWMFKEYTKGQNVHETAPKRSIIDLHGGENVPVKLDIG